MLKTQERTNLLPALTRNWWLPLADGIFIAFLGALAFVFPYVALPVVRWCCALYWLIDGLQSIGLGLSMRHARSRLSWQLLVSGILSITAAIFTLVWPGIEAVALLFVVAIWAIAHGISEIITATHLRKYINREWLFHLVGVLSVLFGVAVLLQPIVGVLIFILMLGSFAIIRGALLCAFAFELRAICRADSTATRQRPFLPHVRG